MVRPTLFIFWSLKSQKVQYTVALFSFNNGDTDFTFSEVHAALSLPLFWWLLK
jgi:hypothetical protein